MCPTDQPGTGPGPTAPNAQVKPTIGTSVVGTPIVIPEGLTLRIYTAYYEPAFTMTDRYGNEVSNVSIVSLLGNLPYWNGSELETANGAFVPPWVDFDGRTFATVLPSEALPYAFLITDPTARAP